MEGVSRMFGGVAADPVAYAGKQNRRLAFAVV